MYQKFLPQGSTGINIFSSNPLEETLAQAAGGNTYLEGHTLVAGNLDNMSVIDHVLIIS